MITVSTDIKIPYPFSRMADVCQQNRRSACILNTSREAAKHHHGLAYSQTLGYIMSAEAWPSIRAVDTSYQRVCSKGSNARTWHGLQLPIPPVTSCHEERRRSRGGDHPRWPSWPSNPVAFAFITELDETPPSAARTGYLPSLQPLHM